MARKGMITPFNKKQLKKTIVENYTFLFGSKSLDIKKELSNLEVTGEINLALDLYRSGKKTIIVSSHSGPYDVALLLFAYYVFDYIRYSSTLLFSHRSIS